MSGDATWLIKFNLEIFQYVLTLGKPKLDHHSSLYSWKPSSRTNTNGARSWVLIDSNLSFESHMAAKITKENQIVGLIRRSFSFLDGEPFRRLLIAFVRPHLEYAQFGCHTNSILIVFSRPKPYLWLRPHGNLNP